MISRAELDEQARILGIHISNVERDYLFGWLLAGIFSISTLKDTIVLKGGNALRKGYLPTTRFSDDLDFSTPTLLDTGMLIAELNNVCRWIQDQTGVIFDYERNGVVGEHFVDKTRVSYKIRIYFEDFAGQGAITLKIRMDVTNYDRLYLPVQTQQLIHQYSDASAVAVPIQVVAIEEALADKLKCLIQRSYANDLFDLVYAVFVSDDLQLDRSQLMNVFLRKSIFGPSPIAAKRLLLGAPLDLARGFWSKVVAPLGSRLDFDDAVARFRDGVDALFAPYGNQPFGAAAFYPPELRTPIMQAGTNRRLLKLTYEGATRLVEPYSLTFKRRGDGVGQEYFFCYDQTGGRSGPGIKSLLNQKIQHVELTDQAFEPRYEIELAKAGDSKMTGYFATTRSAGPRHSRRRQESATTYRVRCVACGKVLTRSTRSLAVRAHKDGYGNNCRGRRGYAV